MKSELYKVDLVYPFFSATVICAFLCAFVLSPWFLVRVNYHDARKVFSKANSPVSAVFDEIPSGMADDATADTLLAPVVPLPVVHISRSAWTIPGGQDEILEAYRDPVIRDQVIAFFSGIIHSSELAQAILANADIYDIPPAVAFALCWEESRFSVRAVNQKNSNGSIDRGLFQLNNRSFPHLGDKDFFDPRTNSYYGLSHLRWCLDFGGSLVAGLAMYNAGTNRVSAGSTPKRTLDYVSSIFTSKQRIEALFNEHRPVFPEVVLAIQEEELIPEEPPLPRKPRLSLLSPAR
jgi:hypothetical protein